MTVALVVAPGYLLWSYRGLLFLRLLLFRSSVQTHWWRLVEEPPRVERALSVEVVRLFLVLLTLLVTGCAIGLQLLPKVTHERRWFPWRLACLSWRVNCESVHVMRALL